MVKVRTTKHRKFVLQSVVVTVDKLSMTFAKYHPGLEHDYFRVTLEKEEVALLQEKLKEWEDGES